MLNSYFKYLCKLCTYIFLKLNKIIIIIIIIIITIIISSLIALELYATILNRAEVPRSLGNMTHL